MPSLEQIFQVYVDLADWHERNGPAYVRDRFLILAAEAALNAGRENEAERLRVRLLGLNPHHLLRPFGSFAEALRSPDVDSYVNDLKHTYPPEVADELLEQIRGRDAPPAEPRPTLPLPPTLPAMELGPRDPPSPRETPGPVVVYWDDPDARSAPIPKPAKRPVTAPQPPVRPTALPQTVVRPIPVPVPTKPTRPAATPRPFRPVLAEEPARSMPPLPTPVPEDDDAFQATWVPSSLFGLMLMVCVALAAYTLVRPLLAPEWLPW
jgi:hypothetical protein